MCAWLQAVNRALREKLTWLVMCKIIQEWCTSVISVNTVPRTSGTSSSINVNIATIYESNAKSATEASDTTPK